MQLLIQYIVAAICICNCETINWFEKKREYLLLSGALCCPENKVTAWDGTIDIHLIYFLVMSRVVSLKMCLSRQLCWDPSFIVVPMLAA